MTPDIENTVEHIRAASRVLVREWGFLNKTIAGTDLSPSAVHAIIEIAAADQITAKELAEKLVLEKSTISRLLRALTDKGIVREVPAKADGRAKLLSLTEQGEGVRAAIDRFATDQVETALAGLADGEAADIAEGLTVYAQALAGRRNGDRDRTAHPRARIRAGYTPAIIGRVTELHAEYYSNLVGFGAYFETKVAGGLAEFVTRLDKPGNEIWYAEHGGRIVGSISIDGEDLGENRAHLRWFIVDPAMRGTGLGRELISRAVAFCDDRKFAKTHLWTFKGLDAARHLYEAHGFQLGDEYLGDQWGHEITEQRFVRRLGGQRIS